MLPALGAPKTSTAPAWRPDAALLNRLAPVARVGQFELRPPKGYAMQRKPGPGKSEGVAWVSAPREDGTRSYVMLVIAQLPAKEARKYTPEQTLDKMLQGVQARRTKDWKRSATEHGMLNGLPFLRARWSGVAQEAPLKLRGFHYLTVLDGKIIQLSSQDLESNPNALKLAEASVLTFKKSN